MSIDWGPAIAVWWSFFWRAILFGAAAGIAVGFIAGITAAIAGEPAKGGIWGGIAGMLVGIPTSMLAMKQSLGKHLPALAALSTAADNG